jgi:hypothetical protein
VLLVNFDDEDDDADLSGDDSGGGDGSVNDSSEGAKVEIDANVGGSIESDDVVDIYNDSEEENQDYPFWGGRI